MWLFAIGGFFSIVEHKDDPDYLLVRARAKSDIERYWPGENIQKTEEADYRYRAKIHRAVVKAAIIKMLDDIKYPSFKGAMEDKERYWRYYTKVNEEMQTMQEELEYESHSN